MIWSRESVVGAAQLPSNALLSTAHKMLSAIDGGTPRGSEEEIAELLRALASAIVGAADEIRKLRKEAAEAARYGITSAIVGERSKKIGRNDHCPCGSGRKWKKCHGRGIR